MKRAHELRTKRTRYEDKYLSDGEQEALREYRAGKAMGGLRRSWQASLHDAWLLDGVAFREARKANAAEREAIRAKLEEVPADQERRKKALRDRHAALMVAYEALVPPPAPDYDEPIPNDWLGPAYKPEPLREPENLSDSEEELIIV